MKQKTLDMNILKKKKSKMTERESFEKYDSFSENELNTKSNKEVYVKIMSWLLLSNIADAKKKKGRKKNRRIKKKIIMIFEFGISECSEYDVKSKIGNIFVNEKIREEHCG